MVSKWCLQSKCEAQKAKSFNNVNYQVNQFYFLICQAKQTRSATTGNFQKETVTLYIHLSIQTNSRLYDVYCMTLSFIQDVIAKRHFVHFVQDAIVHMTFSKLTSSSAILHICEANLFSKTMAE